MDGETGKGTLISVGPHQEDRPRDCLDRPRVVFRVRAGGSLEVIRGKNKGKRVEGPAWHAQAHLWQGSCCCWGWVSNLHLVPTVSIDLTGCSSIRTAILEFKINWGKGQLHKGQVRERENWVGYINNWILLQFHLWVCQGDGTKGLLLLVSSLRPCFRLLSGHRWKDSAWRTNLGRIEGRVDGEGWMDGYQVTVG